MNKETVRSMMDDWVYKFRRSSLASWQISLSPHLVSAVFSPNWRFSPFHLATPGGLIFEVFGDTSGDSRHSGRDGLPT